MHESDVWYHVYPLGFLGAELENPAPGVSGGPVAHRLPKLVDWLDYLVELGVTAVLLGPVFESSTHGYDVVDPFRVDRRLGSEEDLVRLVDECHRRSLRVALDVVFHHVGREHAHFRDVLANREQSVWPDWFEIDFGRPGRDGFAYANFEGHDQLVKLNHANPAVLDWAVDVARYWVERGVDAFRLDAAYALPSAFVAKFADRVRELRSDVFLVGEVIRGDFAQVVRQMHLSTVTQYELWKGIWSSLNDGNFFELAHALKRHVEFCQHFPPWTFVGNHDTTHIARQLSDQRNLGHALVVLFTVPGIPAVYAGDEQGAEGRKYDRAGGDAEVRRPPPYRPGALAGRGLEIWQLHRKLIAIRRARPWLASANLRVINVANRAMTYEAVSSSGRLIVALNIQDTSSKCALPPNAKSVAGQGQAELPSQSWGIWDA